MMKFTNFSASLCFIVCLLSRTMVWGGDGGTSGNAPMPAFKANGLYFVENKGQVRDQDGKERKDIDFKVATNNVQMFVGKGKIHYQWHRARKVIHSGLLSGNVDQVGPASAENLKMNVDFYRMDVTLVGANLDATELVRSRKRADYDLYYNNDGSTSKTAFYQEMTYKNIYPNIDWVLYVEGKSVKYDFIVHPGGRVADIKLLYGGHTHLNLEQGALVAYTPFGNVKEHAPYSYVKESGKEVEVSFSKEDEGLITFNAKEYSGTLVIDPILTFDWGTYYGGTSYEMSAYLGYTLAGYYAASNSLFTDYAGNILMAGTTLSLDNIATTGSFKVGKTEVEGSNAYLVKFTAAGERLWGTYYGGYLGSNGYDQFPDENKMYYYGTRSGRGHSIAADSLGNIYMTGTTWNDSGIATNGAQQAKRSGGWSDLFIVKFDKDGQRQWGTYLGNQGKEEGGSILVSADGQQLYVAGASAAYLISPQSSDNIITPGAHLGYLGSTADHMGFLARFNGEGKRQWGTYIGNTRYGWSTVYDMAMDSKGFLYLTGSSNDAMGALLPTDTSIATLGSHQPFNKGLMDVIVQKWDSTGKRHWGTFYGGTGHDYGYGIACDDDNNVYVTGIAQSATGIATPGSVQDQLKGSMNAFLAKFDADGKRQWGTYYGREGEAGYSVLCANNKIYMVGKAASDSLATPDAYNQYTGTNWNWNAGLLVQLCPLGTLDYSTYFGGSDGDYNYTLANNGIVSITAGRERDSSYSQPIYITGITNVTKGIVSENAYQDTLLGTWDAYLVKFATTTDSYIKEPICKGGTVTYNGVLYQTPGIYLHTFKRNDECDSVVALALYLMEVEKPFITTDNDFTLSTTLPYASYEWLLNGVVIEGAKNAKLLVKANGSYTVIVTNEYGCVDTSEAYIVSNVGIEDVVTNVDRPDVYPNPVTETIIINSKKAVRALLTTIEGRSILDEKEVRKINVAGLPAGVYLLQLYYQDGHLALRQKVVVQ